MLTNDLLTQFAHQETGNTDAEAMVCDYLATFENDSREALLDSLEFWIRHAQGWQELYVTAARDRDREAARLPG